MPLDKVILDHVEELQDIEDQLQDEIDTLIDKLDINEIIDDPELALTELVDIIMNDLLEKKYYPIASKKGTELAKQVDNDIIEVTLSKDPKLNEDLIDVENKG